MNVLEEITNAVSILNKIDEYSSTLQEQFSYCNKKLQDLQHYIENNQMNARECCRIVKEFREVRQYRRKIKNDIELLKTYDTYKDRLVNANSRQFLLAEMNKTNKRLGVKYTNRVYTQEELDKILGKEVEKCM